MRPSSPVPERSVAARIAAVATHVPESELSNDELSAVFGDWTAQKILDKTGIRTRHIAAAEETAADLAFQAASKLFAAGHASPDDVDFLILCTQAPDHVLPTTACLLQDRLGLPTSCGALDVNLGCSGFVYCLSLATGLIAAGAASTILVLTADTYSKYIHERDRSVRTLFGDGAAATLIRRGDPEASARLGPFIYGTDGAGGRDLIVDAGGFRRPRGETTSHASADASGNMRSPENLYMNGGAVLNFTLREVPRTYRSLLAAAGLAEDDVDFVVLHQANRFMLDTLQKKLGLTDAKLPRCFEAVGNTVSSTIPFVLEDLIADGRIRPGTRLLLIGFGVGLSWAGAAVTC